MNKTGFWESHDNGNKPWTCSECGSGCLLNYESDWCLSDYCPHCGVKMVDKKDNFLNNKQEKKK